jgi:hypothetical protein
MKQQPDRAWRGLNSHGHHRYAFLVDGQLTLDRTRKESPQRQNERVSLMPVS